MTSKRGRVLLPLLLAVFGLAACQRPEPESTSVEQAGVEAETPRVPLVEDGVVEVVLEDYSFTAPPALRSGWNTFRMTNDGEEPHFLLFWRLPEGVTFDEYAAEVSQPFQDEYDRYTAGEVGRDEMLANVGAAMPDWYGEVEGMGGVGLTSPGRTSQATVRLEPGDYVMECYVVSAEGQFHGSLGMLRPLIVSSESTGMEAPEADIRITLSNYEMSIEGEPTAGEQTIAVHTTEDPEGIIGHDVHLARLEPDTTIEELIAWMSWIDAMRAPAPAELLGGADEVRAGRTGYFTVTLDPGSYVWISEGFGAEGMVEEFVID